jgi:uncharacterized membrane protein YsdA (DUF1294 family)
MSTTAILLGAYALLNGVAFLAYGNDKRKAQRKEWRTREKVLLLLALAGPFGAYGAMKVFRHKTQKTRFQLVPEFLILHVAVLAFLILYL